MYSSFLGLPAAAGAAHTPKANRAARQRFFNDLFMTCYVFRLCSRLLIISFLLVLSIVMTLEFVCCTLFQQHSF